MDEGALEGMTGQWVGCALSLARTSMDTLAVNVEDGDGVDEGGGGMVEGDQRRTDGGCKKKIQVCLPRVPVGKYSLRGRLPPLFSAPTVLPL